MEAAFELDQTWPQALRSARLVDYRQLTVALASGFSADDRSANVLVNVLAVVRCFTGSEILTLSGAAKTISEVCGLRRSSVVLVRKNVGREVFDAWSPLWPHSIDELLELHRICGSVMTALGEAARALGD